MYQLDGECRNAERSAARVVGDPVVCRAQCSDVVLERRVDETPGLYLRDRVGVAGDDDAGQAKPAGRDHSRESAVEVRVGEPECVHQVVVPRQGAQQGVRVAEEAVFGVVAGPHPTFQFRDGDPVDLGQPQDQVGVVVATHHEAARLGMRLGRHRGRGQFVGPGLADQVGSRSAGGVAGQRVPHPPGVEPQRRDLIAPPVGSQPDTDQARLGEEEPKGFR
ncbi:hypothetical protein GCM10023321_73470 [Pseudonocardia eucalypti]|uniref:Uncharacterized protein n=1 Tax=Pseudonocardia eucalypti TaxID=648755 RepID=A0ABP9R905_9PSEU